MGSVHSSDPLAELSSGGGGLERGLLVEYSYGMETSDARDGHTRASVSADGDRLQVKR